jgi:hypothetical protein
VVDAQAQVQYRHGAAAHVGHAREFGRQSRQLEQRRAPQHFLHFEYIDAKKLAPAQPEQQQRQPVVACKASALVDAVEQIMGHACVSARAGAT